MTVSTFSLLESTEVVDCVVMEHVKIGKELGLVGEALMEFVKKREEEEKRAEQERKDREERAEQQRREERAEQQRREEKAEQQRQEREERAAERELTRH